MKKIYFTIAGAKYYYGTKFMRRGMKVSLEKDHDNDCDNEAIKVKMSGLGIVGYVANSPYTVIGESMSAGRLYDKFNVKASGHILYVLNNCALCLFDDK